MGILFICSVIALAVFLSLSMALLLRHKSYSSHPNLPPGNMGFPIVGESLQFFNAGRKGHPESFIIDRMAKFCPRVFKTCILGEPTVVLCGVQGNKFLFSNENKLVTAWWPSSVDKIFPSQPHVQTSSQEESLKMRKLLPTFLKPEALQRYVGIMDDTAKTHFENSWEGNQKVTVFPLAKRFTFWLACRLFMSIDDPKRVADLEGPFDSLAAGIVSIPIDLPGTSFNKGIKASKLIREELKEIIKQRKAELAEGKASPTQDVLSHMLSAKDEDGFLMSEWEIGNKILGLLIGGHDTASAAITFVINYLAELPEIYNLVYAEQMEIAKSKKPGEMLNWEDMQKMKYSWNVACEVMRLAPPLQGAFREAIHDFDFAGFSIPKGWKLYWNTNSTHRNPEYFPEPEKLDPSRFEGKGPAPYSFVPFGGGPRMCPGKEYARLEILVFIHNLVQRFRWEKVIPSEKVVVDPLPVPAQGLPVLLFPHSPESSPYYKLFNALPHWQQTYIS